MDDEARELAPVEWSPTSAQTWPVLAPDRYEARFASSYKPAQHALPGPTFPSYTLERFAIVGVLSLVCVGDIVDLWITQTPGSLKPLLLLVPIAVLGLAATTTWVVQMSRARRKVINPSSPSVPPYAFAITPTTIEFPATMYQMAASWDRQSTTARLAGRRPRDLVLRCPGRHSRRYQSSTLAEAPEDLIARITGHRPKSTSRMR